MSGCASKASKKHQKYLTSVRTEKERRTPEQYQSYLKNQLLQKRSELSQINARLKELSRSYQGTENQDSPLDSYASANQINMSRMQMTNHNLKEEKRLIEKEIFFIQSQLNK